MIKYLIVLTFIVVGCSSSSKNKEKADAHLQIGTGYLTSGNYPMALQELLRAEELDPDNPVVQNNLAIAYFVRKRYVEAEKHFQRALDISSNYTDALNNLGRTHVEMGKHELAIKELEKVIQDLTYQTPEKAYVNLGIVYLKTKNYKMAQKSLLSALKINRNFCPAHNFYGQALYFQGEYAKAAQALDSAVQLCQDLDEAFYYDALAYQKLGEPGKTRARFQELLNRFPQSEYGDKARAYLESHQ